MIGRRDELKQLIAAIEQTRTGTTTRHLLLGPAGIGKSRLLLEAGLYAEWRGVRVIRNDFATPLADAEAGAEAETRPSIRLHDAPEGSLRASVAAQSSREGATGNSPTDPQPLSIIATARSSEEARALDDSCPHLLELTLAPLSPPESEELIVSLCRATKGLTPPVQWLEKAVNDSAGNPAALESLAYSWLARKSGVAMPSTM